MFRSAAITVLLAGMFGAAACASAGEQGARRDSSVLLPDEIEAATITNLYEAVERLRPRWLDVRGSRSIGGSEGQIVVFMNSSYLGEPEMLRQYHVNQIARIRYLDGPQAAATLSGYPTTRLVVGGIVMETAVRDD